MAVGVFLDDAVLYQQGLDRIKAQLRGAIGSRGLAGVPSGFYIETCRLINAIGTLAGGDLTHTQLGAKGFLEAAIIAKLQGEDLYNYRDPTDNAGIETMFDYHDQWIFFAQRPGSTSSGWPCALALAGLQRCCGHTAIWRLAYNHFLKSPYRAVAEYSERDCPGFECDYPLTHNTIGMGGGGPADTTPPTVPGVPPRWRTPPARLP